MKFPKTLGACVDLAYKAREERLALQRQYDAALKELKAQEEAINLHILETFDAEDIGKVGGAVATASISINYVPTVKDWAQVWKWAKKNDALEIFEKRMAKVAWRERYEAGKLIPGTEPFCVKTLSLTKISK